MARKGSLGTLLRLPLIGALVRICRLCATLMRRTVPRPKVLLILGGSRSRELRCARMIRDVPPNEAPGYIILSSGATPAKDIAAAASLPLVRVAVDRRAVDTLTNFTSLVSDLRYLDCRSVVVATSRGHMRRAFPVGIVVLGAYGMSVGSFVCRDPGDEALYCESRFRALRDVVRAFLWLFTTWDGSGISVMVHPERGQSSVEVGGLCENWRRDFAKSTFPNEHHRAKR